MFANLGFVIVGYACPRRGPAPPRTVLPPPRPPPHACWPPPDPAPRVPRARGRGGGPPPPSLPSFRWVSRRAARPIQTGLEPPSQQGAAQGGAMGGDEFGVVGTGASYRLSSSPKALAKRALSPAHS